MEKTGWLAVIVIIILFGLFGKISTGDSEYETAGKTFSTWVNTDPNKWTNTQKNYFNNFMDWADKH